MVALLEELGRDADAPFRRGSDLFELTWQAREGERGGESGSIKEMSHPRWFAGARFRKNAGGLNFCRHQLLLVLAKFLETRIASQRIEHGIEPKQRGSKRHAPAEDAAARHRP